MCHKKIERAMELVKNGKIKKVSQSVYEILGEEEHTIKFSDEQASCTCTDFVIHGLEEKRIRSVCKHIMAAIIFETLMRINGVKSEKGET